MSNIVVTFDVVSLVKFQVDQYLFFPILVFADLDKFATDDIMDPIAKAKMVALKGIKRVLAQDPMVVPSGVNRYIFFNSSFPMFRMF